MPPTWGSAGAADLYGEIGTAVASTTGGSNSAADAAAAADTAGSGEDDDDGGPLAMYAGLDGESAAGTGEWNASLRQCAAPSAADSWGIKNKRRRREPAPAASTGAQAAASGTSLLAHRRTDDWLAC